MSTIQPLLNLFITIETMMLPDRKFPQSHETCVWISMVPTEEPSTFGLWWGKIWNTLADELDGCCSICSEDQVEVLWVGFEKLQGVESHSFNDFWGQAWRIWVGVWISVEIIDHLVGELIDERSGIDGGTAMIQVDFVWYTHVSYDTDI